jgi:hypothetical protein
VRVLETGREESEVVLERVAIGRLRQQLRAIAASLKAGPLAVEVSDRPKRPARLHLSGVERRVDVDELERFVREAGQELQALAQ